MAWRTTAIRAQLLGHGELLRLELEGKLQINSDHLRSSLLLPLFVMGCLVERQEEHFPLDASGPFGLNRREQHSQSECKDH